MIYTLTNKSRIDAYFMGYDGLSFSHISSYTDTFSRMRRILRKERDMPRVQRLVSIVPVTAFESSHICLMAVTPSGHRCFYSVKVNDGIVESGSFELKIVKLVPGVAGGRAPVRLWDSRER